MDTESNGVLRSVLLSILQQNMNSWGNAIKRGTAVSARAGQASSVQKVMIWYSPDSFLSRDITGGRITGTIDPTSRTLKVSYNRRCIIWVRAGVLVCTVSLICHLCVGLFPHPRPRGRNPVSTANEYQLDKVIVFCHSAICLDAAFYLDVFFPVADVWWWVAAAKWRSAAC